MGLAAEGDVYPFDGGTHVAVLQWDGAGSVPAFRLKQSPRSPNRIQGGEMIGKPNAKPGRCQRNGYALLMGCAIARLTPGSMDWISFLGWTLWRQGLVCAVSVLVKAIDSIIRSAPVR
jgi:hypothetical protein